jgi:hypothetical protein
MTGALADARSRAPDGADVIVIDDPEEFDKLTGYGTVWHRDGYTTVATMLNGEETNFVHLAEAGR